MIKSFNRVADFFLPRICPACENKLIAEEFYVCDNCISNLKLADEERIRYEFSRKFEGKNLITDFASVYVFEKDKELQQIIHSIKYTNKFLIGKFLGEKISEHLSDRLKRWEIDVIIPIPLHHLKKADRGYNQSYYIAKGLGDVLKIKVSDKIVKRIKYTKSQTTMTLIERRENVGQAFKVKNRKKITGKNLLLIDDVITTGATTAECADELLKSGANKVYAASVAIAD